MRQGKEGAVKGVINPGAILRAWNFIPWGNPRSSALPRGRGGEGGKLWYLYKLLRVMGSGMLAEGTRQHFQPAT